MQEPTNNRGAGATKAKADKFALARLPDIKAAIAAGAKGLAKMADWLNKRGISAPRGGLWRTETVRRTCERLVDLGYSEVRAKRYRRMDDLRRILQLGREDLAKQRAETEAEIDKFIASRKAAG